jgi:hypothetical protein
MGMDVYGRAPTSKRGEYFREDYVWWHCLATYCKEVAPRVASGCRDWYTNDGDGLDAAASRALAEALEAEIESGRCADVERQGKAAWEATPKTCFNCGGQGVVWKPRPELIPFFSAKARSFRRPIQSSLLIPGRTGQSYRAPPATACGYHSPLRSASRTCGGSRLSCATAAGS